VTGWVPIVASGASGAVVTLLGVVTGGVVSSRSQRRQWNRDKQVEACTTGIREAAPMQLELLRLRRGRHDIEWTAWNQAMAVLWLVGSPRLVAQAYRMDRLFLAGQKPDR
jgi:hypothetical protein